MNNRNWKIFPFKISSRNSFPFGLFTCFDFCEIIHVSFPTDLFFLGSSSVWLRHFVLYPPVPVSCPSSTQSPWDCYSLQPFLEFQLEKFGVYLDCLVALKVPHTKPKSSWPCPYAKYSLSISHFVNSLTIHLDVYASNSEIILVPFHPSPKPTPVR